MKYEENELEKKKRERWIEEMNVDEREKRIFKIIKIWKFIKILSAEKKKFANIVTQ